MRVINYLQAKYKQKYPTTCLYIEALVFGIPYPLQPAWIVRYGENEITSDQCINLEKRLMACLGKPSKKAYWTESGLKAIARKEVIAKSAELYYQWDKYSSPEWQKSVAAVTALNKQSCTNCGTKNESLTVKHIHDVPALFLDFDNLMCLCCSCSKRLSTKSGLKVCLIGSSPEINLSDQAVNV
jgi:hypothetical protein